MNGFVKSPYALLSFKTRRCDVKITAVDRAAVRSGGSLSAFLDSFRYSRETHPSGSNSHGCLTLHFDKNGDERRAMPLTPPLSTAESGICNRLCTEMPSSGFSDAYCVTLEVMRGSASESQNQTSGTRMSENVVSVHADFHFGSHGRFS